MGVQLDTIDSPMKSLECFGMIGNACLNGQHSRSVNLFSISR